MPRPERPSLTVVVPAYNEVEALPRLLERVFATLDRMPVEARLLLIDDGSSDDTWSALQLLAQREPRVQGLRLSRNFGKEAALSAGLDCVDADLVVVLDADLQDPPELIPEFYQHWLEGADVVYGRRTERLGESWLKRSTAAGFYRLMEKMSDTPIPRDTGDFRLMDRVAVDALRGVRERNRFMKGLFAWIGYRQVEVPYRRDARQVGSSKWNYGRLLRFAVDGITAFSTAPLRIATWFGLATSIVAFAYAVWVIFKTLAFGEPVRGYPSLMVVMLFLGGVQLLAIGLIGEYLARLFVEVKARPLYLVSERLNGLEKDQDPV